MNLEIFMISMIIFFISLVFIFWWNESWDINTCHLGIWKQLVYRISKKKRQNYYDNLIKFGR